MERAAGAGGWSPAGVRVSADGQTAVADLSTAAASGTTRADDQVKALRGSLVEQTVGGARIDRWAVGGDAAESYDTVVHQHVGMLRVLAVVMGLVLVMTGVAFRSVLLALVTTALNLVSVGAAFGVVTLVFQHSWA